MPTSPSAQFDAALSLLQHSPSSASATHFKHILHAAAATSPADNSSTANDTLRFRAANAIPKYFHHFPSLYDDALDRHLDLCEDNSPHIRHAAMRSLYLFATPMSDILTAKAVDVLVQLFQTDSAVELTIVKESLDVAVDRHSVVAVETIWDQLISDAIPFIRPRILEFLISLFEKHFSVDSTSTASDALIRVHLNGLMKFIKLPWARIEHTLAIKDLRKILEKFIAQKSLNGTTKNISKWLSDAIVGFAKADGICPQDESFLPALKALVKTTSALLRPHRIRPVRLCALFRDKILSAESLPCLVQSRTDRLILRLWSDCCSVGRIEGDTNTREWINWVQGLLARLLQADRSNLETACASITSRNMFARIECILHAVVKSIGSIPPSLQSCVSAIGDAVVLLRPNLAANDKFIIVYEAIYAIAINLRTDVVPTWHLSASVKSSSPPKPAPPPPAPLLPPTAVGSSNVWQSSPSKVDLTTSNSIASTPNKGPTQKPIQMLPHESRKKSPMNRDNSVELLAQENREKKRKNPEIKPIVFDLPESGQPQHSKRLKLYNATEKSNIASGLEEASFMVPISAASTDSWQQMSPTATAVTTAESRTSIADRLGCKLSSAMIQQSSASAALPDSANMIDGKSQYSDIPANINGLPRSQLPPNGLHREHAPAPKRSTGRNDNALRLFQLSFLDATHRDNPPPRLRIRRTPITAARDPQISTPPANRIVSSETDPLPRILIANVKPTSISNEVSAGGLLQRANLGTATVTMGPRAPTVIFTPNSMSGGTASIASVAAPPERSIVGAWRKQPA